MKSKAHGVTTGTKRPMRMEILRRAAMLGLRVAKECPGEYVVGSVRFLFHASPKEIAVGI
jgi:hypothetical protein